MHNPARHGHPGCESDADATCSADLILTSLGSDEAVETVYAELFKGQEVGHNQHSAHHVPFHRADMDTMNTDVMDMDSVDLRMFPLRSSRLVTNRCALCNIVIVLTGVLRIKRVKAMGSNLVDGVVLPSLSIPAR